MVSRMFNDFKKLSKLLNLGLKAIDSDFPLLVPESFISRMKLGDKKDPLLLQVLPIEIESMIACGFSDDPLHEMECSKLSGLIHKYHLYD